MNTDRVFRHGLKLLARRDYTVEEMRQCLAARFGEARSRQAVSSLKREGLLDDSRRAQDILRRMQEAGKGYKRIAWEMERRGIPGDTMREVLEGFDYGKELQDARRLSARRTARGGRLPSCLRNRGFSERTMERILEETLES